MKGLIHLLHKVAMVGGALLLSAHALSDTPVGPMNYQGRLLDGAGIPVTNTYDFVVRVYDAANGGTLKYQEAHSATAINDGVYSFMVGTTPKTGGDSTWSVELWNCCATLYMEVEVNSQILTPRHQLAAAPYAFQANLALTTNNALALGGTSAAQYNSTLAAICVSGKGKWLELVGKCLGIGASFPGPTLVNWNTLTASSNFSNLDLSRADVSGINFSGADFTATTFTKTTYAVQGMSGANLYGTTWNSATATDVSATTLSATTNLQSATFSNMDMSKWNLSSISIANVNMLSAATLSSCPAGLPTNWLCRNDGLPSSSNNFLLGPGVNLSAGSAASSYKYGSSYLNLGKTVLNNSNLTGAGFVGNVINQNFINVTLTNVHFDYATLTNNTFDSGTSLLNTTFINAKIDRLVLGNTVDITSADFTDAELNYVKFNLSLPMSNGVFLGATLRGVSFNDLNNSNFTNSVLDNVSINGINYNNNFTNVRFYNGFRHGPTSTTTMSYQGGSTFSNVSFIGGTLSGDFNGAVFTGVTTFDTITLTHLDLCHANIPLVDTSAPHDDLKTITWVGAIECPNAANVTGGSGCNTGTNWTTFTGGTCDPGIP